MSEQKSLMQQRKALALPRGAGTLCHGYAIPMPQFRQALDILSLIMTSSATDVEQGAVIA